MDRHTLFKTVHGSKLYGLSHAGSDDDYFTVCANRPKTKARYAKQKLYASGEDSVVMDFSTWLQSCAKGVPQALEAMFSHKPIVDEIYAFRSYYHVHTPVYETYLRTMKNFIYAGDYKRKRHALRLALNMADIRRAGRFDPTLTPEQVDFVSDVAYKDQDVVYAYCMNIALDRLPKGLQ